MHGSRVTAPSSCKYSRLDLVNYEWNTMCLSYVQHRRLRLIRGRGRLDNVKDGVSPLSLIN